MKQFLVYFGLFLFFAAAIGSVRYLDTYSRQYESCAQKWKTSLDLAQGQPGLANRLLDMEKNGQMRLGGKACPSLTADHARHVRAQLESLAR